MIYVLSGVLVDLVCIFRLIVEQRVDDLKENMWPILFEERVQPIKLAACG